METKKLNRDEIIAALRQFDEGVYGYSFDFDDTEDLYNRLSETAKELGYTAEDLIIAAKEGF